MISFANCIQRRDLKKKQAAASSFSDAENIISSMDTRTIEEDKVVDAEVVENPLEAEEKREELAKLAQEKLEAYAARRRKYWAEQEKRAKKTLAKRRKADKAAKRARRKNRK